MAVIRSSILGRVDGGWSRVLRDLLKLTLVGATGMQRAGIPVLIQDAHAIIYCKVGCLLSDGDGLRMALQWMGASNLHPCFRRWLLFIDLRFQIPHDWLYLLGMLFPGTGTSS